MRAVKIWISDSMYFSLDAILRYTQKRKLLCFDTFELSLRSSLWIDANLQIYFRVFSIDTFRRIFSKIDRRLVRFIFPGYEILQLIPLRLIASE